MASNANVTRGEQMLALRRRRMAQSHPFFRGGFRPFFFGAAAWGLLALGLWIWSLAGGVVLPTAVDALAWHRHEMLFGFVGAAISGFLLTAVPNWTGRLPIAGGPLAALFGMWVAARLSLLFSSVTGLWLAAMLDVGFVVVLAALAGREVLQSTNRNLPAVGMVLLFASANAIDYLGFAQAVPPDLGWMLAMAIVILLISLIGGRIIPSFTRNWMAKRGTGRGLPTQPGRFDISVIVLTAFALLGWLTGPAGMPIALLLIAAGALQAVRLARWRGIHALSDPLVLVLHVGYAWIPAGLALLGLSLVDVVPRSAAIHALTAGAMATMILAVMTRASLGHTGRELKAGPATTAIYLAVTAGALLRVAASLNLVDYMMGIEIAGIAWGGALLLFLIAYYPVLWKARPDEAG